MNGARPPRTAASPSERAIVALESLLSEQRRAMATADLGALGAINDRITALLSDPAWRRDAARASSRTRVRTALRYAALNAGLAARGEARAARALAAMGGAQGLYTASGALGAGPGRARRIAA